MHESVMALLAQGVARHEIAEICGITPEYVTMLAKQPVCKAYLEDLKEFARSQLHAATELSAKAIIDTLRTGSNEDRLKAARLQLEVTDQIGPNRRRQGDGVSEEQKLETIAELLLGKLRTPQGVTVESTATPVYDEPFGPLSHIQSPSTEQSENPGSTRGQPGRTAPTQGESLEEVQAEGQGQSEPNGTVPSPGSETA